MNFLSHYYFERFASFPELVLGSLLPDLLKNIDKNYSFQIQRSERELDFHPKALAITEGWLRHVEVDKVFHSSDFFMNTPIGYVNKSSMWSKGCLYVPLSWPIFRWSCFWTIF